MGKVNFEKIREREHQRAWIAQILATLQAQAWYGTITINVDDGMIKRVIKEDSLVPPPCPADNRPVKEKS